MVKVGDVLKNPENGWSRFDDTDSRITYNGNWKLSSISGYYNNTNHEANNLNAQYSFIFKGTKIRIIDALATNRSKVVSVSIDGIEEEYSAYKSSTTRGVLVYEKIGLTNGFHKVVVTNKESLFVSLDAIDIDVDGELYSINQNTNRLFIKQSNNYFYYFNSNWNYINSSTLIEDLYKFGMVNIDSQLLSDFENAHGIDWEIVNWNPNKINNSVEIEAVPHSQLVYSTGDISLIGVELIDSLNLVASGDTRTAISFDSGLNFYSHNLGKWEIVKNAHEGMPISKFNSLNTSEINELRGNSNTVRFSYSLVESAEIDLIEMKVTLQGTEQLASTSDYEISYDQSNKTINVEFKKAGTYTINYIDG